MLCICYVKIIVTDVVEYLYHNKIPEIQTAPTDKFLPKIIYKDGKVSLLNTESGKTITDDQETDCSTDSEN